MPSIHPALRMSLVGLSAAFLTGCHGWSQRQAEDAQVPEAAGVLAELGVARSAHHTRPNDRPAGPSLVAGDSIAWSWAMAFNQAPAGEHPNWAFAGVTLD